MVETFQRSAVPALGDGFNQTIHGMRGVAALLVLLSHIVGGLAEHAHAGDAAYVPVALSLQRIGIWAVFLFFVISGFVIAPSALKSGTGEFARNRLLRIYPLFLVCTLVFIALNAITNAYPELANWQTIVAALLFMDLFTPTVQLTPNAWSLTYEMMFYLLAGAAVFGWRRGGWVGLAPVAIAAAAFLIFFPRAFFFAGGVLVWWASTRQRWQAQPVLEGAALALTVGLLLWAPFKFRIEELARPETWLLLIGLTIYFQLAIAAGSLTGRLLSGRAVQFLGTVSYSLYLTHAYVYLAFRELFERLGFFGGNPWMSVFILAAAVVPVSVVVATLSYRLIELPFQRLGRAPRKPAPVLAMT